MSAVNFVDLLSNLPGFSVKGFAGFKPTASSPFGSLKPYVSAEAQKDHGQGWRSSEYL